MRYTIVFFILFFVGSVKAQKVYDSSIFEKERERIIKRAKDYKKQKPITVTATVCERSAGGQHDFYSEGDYWWQDPENLDGPYIRKDGLTNPNNFTAHREAMIRLSQISGALASAYLITNNKNFAVELAPHLKAWFIDEATMMNPNLLYGQAIMGRVTGRGIGIIDTIHLMEVAKAVMVIENSGALSNKEIATIKDWFVQYLNWITTHSYGIAERDNGNNHSVCWAMQVSVFAELIDNNEVMEYCRNMYKNVLLPDQMSKEGGFPLELERSKPYGYSLFTLDAMSTICQVLSTAEDNLFQFTIDKKNLALGISFLYPYMEDKSNWPYKKDVAYWNEWPVRHSFLLFGGLALNKPEYISLWNSLEADFETPEVVRNMPIRYPLLWMN